MPAAAGQKCLDVNIWSDYNGLHFKTLVCQTVKMKKVLHFSFHIPSTKITTVILLHIQFFHLSHLSENCKVLLLGPQKPEKNPAFDIFVSGDLFL